MRKILVLGKQIEIHIVMVPNLMKQTTCIYLHMCS